MLTRSNIGASSMQKLTGAASRAQLIPNADMQNEIQVSVSPSLSCQNSDYIRDSNSRLFLASGEQSRLFGDKDNHRGIGLDSKDGWAAVNDVTLWLTDQADRAEPGDYRTDTLGRDSYQSDDPSNRKHWGGFTRSTCNEREHWIGNSGHCQARKRWIENLFNCLRS